MITPIWVFTVLVFYFVVLLSLSYYRSRSATLSDYYIGSKSSTWWLVTLGMISDSVSGVTFISVPGSVSSHQYSYFQVVCGYFLGYFIITFLLLPLYYRKNLISIYSYLGERFGIEAQKMGSVFFILSRTFGSAARLYISVMVLHQFLFSGMGISPIGSFTISMALIVLYTYKGGIKSLVWTEAYQSVVLLVAVFLMVGVFWNVTPDPWAAIWAPQIFFTDPLQPNFFLKQVFGGMLITTAMNGLDQNIMQLNLSCKKIGDAQKNMLTLAFVMVAVNFVFLAMGALVQNYYQTHGLAIPAADQSLSTLVFQHLGVFPAVCFIAGLSAATFSSAGTILPAIASSVELDLLPKRLKDRIPVRLVHVLAAVVILVIIIGMYYAGTTSLIDLVLRFAGYTYGPLVALYGIGIFSKMSLNSRKIPVLCILAIGLTAFLDWKSPVWFHGYKIGTELIAINALFAFTFLVVFAKDSAPRT